MALVGKVVLDTKVLERAYVCVKRISGVEKNVDLVATIFVYADQKSRLAEREPERQFNLQVPYSVTPFAGVYAALKLAYPDHEDA